MSVLPLPITTAEDAAGAPVNSSLAINLTRCVRLCKTSPKGMEEPIHDLTTHVDLTAAETRLTRVPTAPDTGPTVANWYKYIEALHTVLKDTDYRFVAIKGEAKHWHMYVAARIALHQLLPSCCTTLVYIDGGYTAVENLSRSHAIRRWIFQSPVKHVTALSVLTSGFALLQSATAGVTRLPP